MQFEVALDQIVVFELPTRSAGELIMRYVSAERLAWLETGDGVCLVGVVLLPDVDDFAALMEGVHGWLESSGLPAISFEIDGRTYALEKTQLALAAAE